MSWLCLLSLGSFMVSSKSCAVRICFVSHPDACRFPIRKSAIMYFTGEINKWTGRLVKDSWTGPYISSQESQFNRGKRVKRENLEDVPPVCFPRGHVRTCTRNNMYIGFSAACTLFSSVFAPFQYLLLGLRYACFRINWVTSIYNERKRQPMRGRRKR